MRKLLAAFAAIALAGAAFAQEAAPAPTNPFSFQGGIDLGTDALPTGPKDADGLPTMESWTRLGFQPDIAFGKFGIGVDLTFRLKLYPQDSDKSVEFYQGDWDPNYTDAYGKKKNFLDIYLPKIMYVRYGLKGEDPFFVKLGSINDLTLGNGFIVGNYANTRFLPDLRIFGLDLGLDGAMFNFPMVGGEFLTGNMARFDVFGGRIFVRPLVGTELPLLKNMQVGVTGAFDTQPDLYMDTTESAGTVGVFGVDAMVPIITSELFPMAAFADTAFEPKGRWGSMVGIGGRLIKIFTYGLQIRLLGPDFIPTYFDANYDLYRALKFDLMQESASGSPFAGWYASLGTSLIKDKLVLMASLDGPMKPIPSSDSALQSDYPHARAIFRLAEGVIGGFFFDAVYEKYFLGREDGFFNDLVDPTDAVIGLAINYRTGATVLTMKYDAKYNPTTNDFEVRSSLSASVKF